MADTGSIDFFEGNDCKQRNLGSVPYLPALYDLQLSGGEPIPDDEARSCRLYNLTPGSIKLFSSAKTDDDWTEIQILQYVEVYDVDSFEEPVDTFHVKVVPHGTKLDGKVSLIQVIPA